jgi:adenine-specific DNA-methyltransferase
MNGILYVEPFIDELPSDYADRLGIYYTQQVSIKHKKENGQFFTPIPIAKLMASFSKLAKKKIRILDPGCGTAILSCVLVERIVNQNKDIKQIELIAYETDKQIISFSHKTLEYLQVWLSNKGINFNYELHPDDFILENAKSLKKETNDTYDIIISNPPYFKLAKTDKRAISSPELISGQPNIYSIFMGISARLLSPEGELIFITPRSFASGNYFKAFRELFFNTVQIENIHLFNSRKDTFNRDSVLQETVIIKASKETINPNKQVLISSSSGIKDILQPTIKIFPSEVLINLNSREKILHLPTTDTEEMILQLVSSWKYTLIDFGIQVSTGPVVSFRASHLIQNHYENGTVFLAPLFWLHNVDKMTLEWPKDFKNKGQYIRIENTSKSLLIPNKDYIFLRRFSTKDDKSRLIATPYFSDFSKAEYIGVENKVNYIYRKSGHLAKNEVIGLSALLNSQLLDIYFQIFNGNVNVSATELREMRFPSLEDIKKIGDKIIFSNNYTMTKINQVISNYFKFETILTNE